MRLNPMRTDPMRPKPRNPVLLAALALLVAVVLGCGGGGGSVIPQNPELVGNVLWIETGAATNPPATVRVGQASTTTSSQDGFFSLRVPAGVTSFTVSFTPSGSSDPVVRSFTIPPVLADTDLGDIYIGPETVTLTGTLRDSTNNALIPNARATFAGQSALSGPDGRFAITGVAYSGQTQSVFLGLQGTANRTGYFTAFFTPPGPASLGALDVGTVLMTPQGDDTAPPLPANVNGAATPNGAGASITVRESGNIVRTTTAGPNGAFQLWLPAGAFTVTATSGTRSGTANLTIANPAQTTNLTVTLN